MLNKSLKDIDQFLEFCIDETVSDKLPYKLKEKFENALIASAGWLGDITPHGQKIAMTTPVIMEMGQQTEMAFVMPKQYNIEDLPQPNSQQVQLIKKEARTLAVLRFGGYSDDAKIQEKAAELSALLRKEQIAFSNKLIYMGYNAPWDFIGRRNEVAYELDALN